MMPKVSVAKLAFALVACIGSVIVGAIPAAAKPGDKAWSQCAWNVAPDSVQAWLSMPAPTWQSSYTDASVLLGHRLIALCDNSTADRLKPNRMPSWKSIAAALRRETPKGAPASAGTSVEVLLCRSSIDTDGKPLTFLYEIVRREAGKESISFDQYYDQVQGQPLKLPQDLRIQPKDPSQVKRSCQIIGAKGELTDA